MQVMTKLSFPFTVEKIRALKVGGEVLVSGVGFQCVGLARSKPVGLSVTWA
jgi:hypothetical protein